MDELNSLLRRQAASQTRLATEISRLRGALAVGDGAGAAAVAADGLKRLKDDHKVVHAAASKLGKAIDRDHERDLRHLRCDALFGPTATRGICGAIVDHLTRAGHLAAAAAVVADTCCLAPALPAKRLPPAAATTAGSNSSSSSSSVAPAPAAVPLATALAEAHADAARIRAGDVQPALAWCRHAHSSGNDGGDQLRRLEWRLHVAHFGQLLTGRLWVQAAPRLQPHSTGSNEDDGDSSGGSSGGSSSSGSGSSSRAATSSANASATGDASSRPPVLVVLQSPADAVALARAYATAAFPPFTAPAAAQGEVQAEVVDGGKRPPSAAALLAAVALRDAAVCMAASVVAQFPPALDSSNSSASATSATSDGADSGASAAAGAVASADASSSAARCAPVVRRLEASPGEYAARLPLAADQLAALASDYTAARLSLLELPAGADASPLGVLASTGMVALPAIAHAHDGWAATQAAVAGAGPGNDDASLAAACGASVGSMPVPAASATDVVYPAKLPLLPLVPAAAAAAAGATGCGGSGSGACGREVVAIEALPLPTALLPTQLPMPMPLRRHSVFVCPVTRSQCDPATNPPMLLACGHVISKESLARMSAARPRFKCPTCPLVQTEGEAVPLVLDSWLVQ